MCHPQINVIEPFKVECFLTKMLRFQQYAVIIYDVSADFRILFGMWNDFVMSYPCTKFQHDITIRNIINCIFLVLFSVFLEKGQKSQYNDFIIYDVINFMHVFFIFKLTF